jgi:hypothetical protein
MVGTWLGLDRCNRDIDRAGQYAVTNSPLLQRLVEEKLSRFTGVYL